MPFRLKVLVAFHAAIAVIACIIAWSLPPSIQYLPLTWVAGGVLLGQIGLLSFWLGMGTSHFKKRLLGVLVATVYLSAVIVVWRPMGRGSNDPPSALGLSFLQAVIVFQALLWCFAAAFFAIRKWISRLVRVSDPAILPTAKLQFTIFQIFLLTTVVAMLFGLRRWVGEMNSTSGTAQGLLLNVLMFLVLLINLLCALWSSLGSGKTWLRVTLVLATATVLGLFPVSSTAVGQLSWLYLLSTLLTVVPTVVVVASLLVMRSCGFRLLPISVR